MPIARKAYEAHHRTQAEAKGSTDELLRKVIAQQKDILKALEKLTAGKKNKK